MPSRLRGIPCGASRQKARRNANRRLQGRYGPRRRGIGCIAALPVVRIPRSAWARAPQAACYAPALRCSRQKSQRGYSKETALSHSMRERASTIRVYPSRSRSSRRFSTQQSLGFNLRYNPARSPQAVVAGGRPSARTRQEPASVQDRRGQRDPRKRPRARGSDHGAS